MTSEARTAFIIRAHSADDKTRDLIRKISKAEGIEVFVCVNETGGSVDLGRDVRKLAISLETFSELGIFCKNQYTMRHLSDVLFYIIKREIPGFDHYALIEYDVEVQNTSFIQTLAQMLSTELRTAALIATFVHPQDKGWHWHAAASKHFPKVLSAFFPFVVLSAPAIDYLRERRMSELAQRNSDGLEHDANGGSGVDQWVYCEAFVPSALALDEKWKLLDFNAALPQTYESRSFNIGPPQLFELDAVYDASAAIVHPVCSGEDMLRKHLYLSTQNGTVDEFIGDLRSKRWNISEGLRTTVLLEAERIAKSRLHIARTELPSRSELQILTLSDWRYSLEDGTLLAPLLKFHDNGYIGGRRHSNEHMWTYREGCLVFLDEIGRVSSTFESPRRCENGRLRITGRFRAGVGVVLDQAPLPIAFASADSYLDLIMSPSPTKRRNLVVIRANENSLHTKWARDLSDQDRTWDLCVSFYGVEGNFAQDEFAEFRVNQNRDRKYRALWTLFHSDSPFWEYDYVCFPDDDLEMKWSDLNVLFDACKYYELSLAQPSLSHDSFWNYPETRQNGKFVLRYLAMIECMMPVFSRAALRKCVPTFQLQPDGFGIDFAWSRLVGNNPAKIAVIDKVAVRHTKPAAEHIKNRAEGHVISAMFGKTGHFTPKERGGVYIEPSEE